MTGCASFHLVKVRPGRQPLALARLGTDRIGLARTPGLRFWRLLGTGNGASTGPGADLTRTAMFAVWDDECSLEAFLDTRRRRDAVEQYVVRLHGIGGHGTWNGFDVLGAIPTINQAADAPVAVLTRARVRLRHWRTFAGVSGAVDAGLQAAPGLLAVCGIGEAPVGLQATFSLWRSATDARRFAYDTREHREVVRRTRAEDWFGEELFASFAPFASAGTWNGRDPLSPVG